MHLLKKVDYIIVGFGIAGISFCEHLRRNNKSFVVFDSGKASSTLVSGGVFNPLVLKRFTKCWNADIFLDYAIPFYATLSNYLQTQIFHEIPILRILNSIEEQNNWTVASDKKSMASYMHKDTITNDNLQIIAPHGYGKLLHTGKVHPEKLKQLYTRLLLDAEDLFTTSFDYKEVTESDGYIEYNNIQASHIVFAEGSMAVQNPFFPDQFLVGKKGEYLIINAPELQLKEILKGPLFVIPLGNSLYKIGATFSNDDINLDTTVSAREEILAKLEQMIQCDYTVVDHMAGVRPTSKDRRPLIGKLKSDSRMAFLNGLGTRGILMAPLLSRMLYEYLENGTGLSEEINITRFTNR